MSKNNQINYAIWDIIKQSKTMLTKFKNMENVYPRKDLRRLRRYRYPEEVIKAKEERKLRMLA